MKFKVPSGDSGVYFRGSEGGQYGFFGPQVQVFPPDDVGGVIELGVQNRQTTVRSTSPADASQRFFVRDDWNELELDALGPHVSVRVNGVTTAELHDEVLYRNGNIAIQLFGNKDTEVLITDVRIRRIRRSNLPMMQWSSEDTTIRPSVRSL